VELLKLGWVGVESSLFRRAQPVSFTAGNPNLRSQYSTMGGRCLIAMVSRAALNRTGRRMIVKPFVVLAARCLGPGPLRLQMVKLAHEMGEGQNYFEVFYGRQRLQPRPAVDPPAQSSRRAA
jgi:hypothetical protein